MKMNIPKEQVLNDFVKLTGFRYLYSSAPGDRYGKRYVFQEGVFFFKDMATFVDISRRIINRG